MSNAVFPTLAGLGWDVGRTPIWDTTVQENCSGKEVRIGNQTYPRHQWDLVFDFLRQGSINGTVYSEFSQLFGFFNARMGQFDSFLYTDPDDCNATGQGIGTGNGSNKAFQLVRAFGGFVEPILAPNVVSAVKLNGVTQSPANYSVSAWGTANPGVITFTTAPGSGVAITADFSFYWPCRFTSDSLPFNKFVANLWAGKSLSFKSVKN